MEKQITREEVLKIDFYDFCGSWAVFMTDDDKIKCYEEMFKVKIK
ncbi:MAG TPA: hypothetical protein VN026_11525 [Bacteroidia bacterium]|jgi:hypothetical protein|nr:hypothetical protein [Bacteroidia bacterium]